MNPPAVHRARSQRSRIRTRRRVGPVGLGAVLMVLAMAATACEPVEPGEPDLTIGNCPMFPADNYWHADVRGLPVRPESAAWVNNIGRNARFHTDFGSGEWRGAPIGIPYLTVGAETPHVPVNFFYPRESDAGPYPLRFDAPVEGDQNSSGDRHVLTVDSETCTLYELFDGRRGATPSSPWSAGSGAIYDLRSNAMRPLNHTSADAAGLPILPGLLRYDEVDSGKINHAIRFTAPYSQNRFIWPARHQASSSTDSNRPPFGAWFRLRADYPTAGLSPHAVTIIEAMKVHGIILADHGLSWYMTGVPDERWDNQALAQIWNITGADMEAVDQTSLMVDPNSGQVRQ